MALTKKNRIILTVTILVMVAVLISCLLTAVFYTNSFVVNEVEYKNAKIPQSFDGFKIAQVSDFHARKFKNNELIEAIKKQEPDIIVITGDYIDRYNLDRLDYALDVLKQLIEIAPTYYVTGNHEAFMKGFSEYKAKIKEMGVIYLNSSREEIRRGDDTIALIGIADPQHYYRKGNITTEYSDHFNKYLTKLTKDDNKFTICLSHRGEYYKLFSKYNVDFIIAGHLHGGQFALPLVGPIYMKNMGLFPGELSGFKQEKQTTVFTSKGIGVTGKLPFRFYVEAELPIITLRSDS